MDCKDVLTDMLVKLKEEIGRYRSGEKDRYFYKCRHTEDYGDIDENYGRRGRVLYGLRFGAVKVGEPEREQMVRELFVQEIIARERSSFQGIGANLELLAALMEQYRKPEDEELYQRAKNANFDCYCGFMTEGCYADQYPVDIYEYSLEDSIYLADELGMTGEVCELVDIFKSSAGKDEIADRMKSFARMTGRAEDRKLAVIYAYDKAFRAEIKNKSQEMKALVAAEDMIKFLCVSGEAAVAETLFKQHTELLLSANGRSYYQCALALMKADSRLVRMLWKTVKKQVKKSAAKRVLYPVCYGDLKLCAEEAGDKLSYTLFERLDKRNK